MPISESLSTLPTVALSLLPSDWTLAELQHRLGDIPAHRILVHPPPGYATEVDLLRLADQPVTVASLGYLDGFDVLPGLQISLDELFL